MTFSDGEKSEVKDGCVCVPNASCTVGDFASHLGLFLGRCGSLTVYACVHAGVKGENGSTVVLIVDLYCRKLNRYI